MAENRRCAYCGLNRCKCKYRFLRMGSFGMTVSNITEQTTASEARKAFEETFGGFEPDTPVAFSFSITKLDLEKIAKAKQKRLAQS